MKKEMILWSCAALLILGSIGLAEEPRPFIGVSLDAVPLPELLTKHLRLDPGQGVRINNIMTGSPADRAGLDRDDIVCTFQGQKITDRDQVIEAVRKAGIGTTVSVEVIHLGQHQTVSAKLESVPDRKTAQWRYPPEPDMVTSWRPGKVFVIRPDGRGIMEMPNVDMKNFFKESYTYQHTTGGENYSITIEGDPADKDSQVAVHAGDKDYTATVGKIESLPEKYREAAQQAVEDARTNVKLDVHIQGSPLTEGLGPDARRKLIESLPRLDPDRFTEQKDAALEKLRGQMEQLQQRMKEMEERNRELMDKLLQKYETRKSTESQPPVPAEPKQKPAT